MTEPSQHRTEIGRELALLDAVQIGPGTERRWFAGQHDRSDRVGAARGDRRLDVEQFEERGVVDRVAALGSIERHDCDETTVFEVDGHDRSGSARSMT